VLEQRIALCLVSFLCVSARQALVQSVLDRKPYSGASLSLLTPAKNQQRGYVALYRYIEQADTVFVLAIRSQREAGYGRA